MPILRKREIENLQQMSGEEIEAFLESLPAGREQLEDLFDYLEFKLEREECNHSLRFAMQYMMENRLNFPKVTAWLNNNGGYCDCKVMEEIAPVWRETFGE
jgi:glyceraldehyde-3-phosphate dehydrogenase/erythrose-4-phosphate dehydrogenase